MKNKKTADLALKKVRSNEVRVINRAIAFFKSFTFEDSLNFEQATNDLIISVEELLKADEAFFLVRINEAKK